MEPMPVCHQSSPSPYAVLNPVRRWPGMGTRIMTPATMKVGIAGKTRTTAAGVNTRTRLKDA
jgi:hypothetical protein